MSETTHISAEENGLSTCLARLDWLDSTGKEALTAVDELYDVATVLKNTDLAGNGKADEVPICPSESASATTMGFSSALGLHGLRNDLVFPDANGTVVMEAAGDDCTRLLIDVNKLLVEGLLGPPFAAINDNQVPKQNMATNRACMYDTAMGWYLSSTDTIFASDPNVRVTAVPPLSSSGVKPSMERAPAECKRWAITESCKTPDVARHGHPIPPHVRPVAQRWREAAARGRHPCRYPCAEILPHPQSHFVPRPMGTAQQDKRLGNADLATHVAGSRMLFVAGKTSFD